jgi:hypothetical protein
VAKHVSASITVSATWATPKDASSLERLLIGYGLKTANFRQSLQSCHPCVILLVATPSTGDVIAITPRR